MHWLNQNAGAIQAISTVILAFITAWYVMVTRKIARSSAAQVQQMRETLRINQEQDVRSLFFLARRLRNSVSKVTEPSDAKLRAFSELTEHDISDVETLAKVVGGSGVLNSANQAVVFLRNVLAVIQKVKSIREGIGRSATPQELNDWRIGIEGSHRSLQEIETACQQLVPSLAQL